MIIPSIDIMNGKAVQLRQGKEKVLEVDDVLGLAREFRKYGEIAVIDLDAALGRGDNFELIRQICKIADCRVGGGIRTRQKAIELLKAGAKKIIIGTLATPDFLKSLPKDKLIVAVDTKNGSIVTEGWTKSEGKNPFEQIKYLEDYCNEFLFTNVDREGMLAGVDDELVKMLKKTSAKKITFAGGITTIEQIKLLEDSGLNSQIGMALYTGKIKLADSFVSLLDFDKNNGLVPTIVQDDKGQVLMMAFSSKESLMKTFDSGNANYYSRSRKRIWQKGETSQNTQELLKARYDCDRDTLLFTVKQAGFACHIGSYSCFSDMQPSISEIYRGIYEKAKNPVIDSYTSDISKNEDSIKNKISEEAGEVVNYQNRDNLVWEIADLAYFTMILMAKNDISIQEIKNELWRRRK